MSLPPKTGRLKTGFRPVGTSSGRQPGTATRLTTAMNPGTAYPGGRTVGVGALNSQLTIVDRPTTQQGLVTVKTGVRGPQRQVQDETYYLGVIRAKNNELTAEIARLKKEVESLNEENSRFLSYEKRAEALAAEIRDLQGELGDYNTLVDKLTTDEDIRDVENDFNDLKAQNAKEIKNMERIFEIKNEKENQIKLLERELEQEKELADSLINDMEPEMKKTYFKLKDKNEHFLDIMEKNQQRIDAINVKIQNLEEELFMSPTKQKAVHLYKRMHALEAQKNSLLEDLNSKESPEEERNRLLQQLKSDNQEIASIERQIQSLQKEYQIMKDEAMQIESDIQESQSEGYQKYQKLKKKEVDIDEFIENFDQNRQNEQTSMKQAEANIVALLEKISVNLSHSTQMPSSEEFMTMKQDLNFKEDEMKKSKNTSSALTSENKKLHDDLQKVEQLETKVHQNIQTLETKINKMKEELVQYQDIQGLKQRSEQRKEKLLHDKEVLLTQKNCLKNFVDNMASKYESLKAELAENDTNAQLVTHEKKWQQLEQINLNMKGFISSNNAKCDYKSVQKEAFEHVDTYNLQLQLKLAAQSAL